MSTLAEAAEQVIDQPMASTPENLSLLAGLLSSPTNESLTLLEQLAEEHAWLRQAVAELGTTPLEGWQAEHTRLFVSGYPHTACPPFESAYRGGDMGGKAAADLSELYRRVGLEPDEVAPDYLGTELECAAYLLARPEPVDETLWKQLWDTHLRGWVPRFARSLISESDLLLYRQVGAQLSTLFREDA